MFVERGLARERVRKEEEEKRQGFISNSKYFALVTDFMMRLRIGKRIHLCERETDDLAEGLNALFEREVKILRMRHCSQQTLDTLIDEEAFLLAQYLRNEKKSWIPRLVSV